ncbi:MAG: helix-turn-helix transcriptional regulator [Phycisphaerales bacterium]
MAIRVRKSSGNVFRDIGFGAAEAENLRVRSLLMIKIEKLISARGWTQNEAAKALGVSQPRISDLVRGKIDKFSADMLIEMLGRAGVEVKITTKTRRCVA